MPHRHYGRKVCGTIFTARNGTAVLPHFALVQRYTLSGIAVFSFYAKRGNTMITPPKCHTKMAKPGVRIPFFALPRTMLSGLHRKNEMQYCQKDKHYCLNEKHSCQNEIRTLFSVFQHSVNKTFTQTTKSV